MSVDVQELEIYSYKPQLGDILVVRNTEIEITAQQSEEIRELVRRKLELPSEVKIMVVGRDWEVSAVREET